MYELCLDPAIFVGAGPVVALAGTDPGGPLHPHTSCHRKLNHSWSSNASGEDLIIMESDHSDILLPLKAVVVPGTGGAGAGAAGAGAAGGFYSMWRMILC